MTGAPQVLVVGAGPVGLAMAAELLRHGTSVRVIDQRPSASDHSKALVLWPRTLELMATMGCVEDAIATGLKVSRVRLVSNRRTLASVALDRVPTRYPFGLFVPQAETERLLTMHLERLGGRVERCVALTGLNAGDDGVDLWLRQETDSAEEHVRMPWVVACDGAHSTVRHALGLAFTGRTDPSEWLLADVRLEGDIPENEVIIAWHEDGVVALFPITAGRFRLIADLGMAPAEGYAKQPDLAEVQAILDTRGPGGIRAVEAFWLNTFRVNERKLAEYRHGRVLFAGDAAHVHSPAGGQGMNTGIQDVCNLAWKLSLVCRGVVADGLLLDSYSSERSAIGDRVLRGADRLTRVALLRNTFTRMIRDLAISTLGMLPPVQDSIVAMLAELDITYPDSPLSRRAQGGPLGTGLLRPGDRAPDAALVTADGTRIDLTALLGRGRFVVVTTPVEATPVDVAAALAPYAELVVAAALATSTAGYAAGEARYVIRPDGHVGLIARDDDRAVLDYLTDILGAQRP